MAMHPDTERIVRTWLTSRPVTKCPFCQDEDWAISEVVAFPVVETPLTWPAITLTPGPALMPLVPITCQHCGYTALFFASEVGVVKPPPGP